MMLPLPCRLYVVPQTWQTRLEIAKAIRTLAAQDEEEQRRRRTEVAATTYDDDELIKQIFREILQELRKAGYRPDQPRWPAGSSDISGR